MANVWEYLSTDLEESHGKIMKTVKYILNNNGGIAWPLLSFFLFAYAWNELALFWKIFISIMWFLLLIVAILTPIAQRHEHRTREEEYKQKLMKVENIPSIIKILDDARKEYKWQPEYPDVWKELNSIRSIK